MNDTFAHRSPDADALLSRFALRVTARLSEQALATGHDVSERLRFGREQALERARASRAAVVAPAAQISGAGAASLTLVGAPRPTSPWWVKLASALPLVVLVAGLMLIQNQHIHAQISAAAEIDSALLVDPLPPGAYSDPGFVEYLKAPRD